MSEFNKVLNKTGVALAALLHSLSNGDFDSDLKALASEPQPAEALMKLEQGELATGLRNLLRQSSNSTMVVSSTHAAPKPSMRVLSRIETDPDAENEGSQAERSQIPMMQERLFVKPKCLELFSTV